MLYKPYHLCIVDNELPYNILYPVVELNGDSYSSLNPPLIFNPQLVDVYGSVLSSISLSVIVILAALSGLEDPLSYSLLTLYADP